MSPSSIGSWGKFFRLEPAGEINSGARKPVIDLVVANKSGALVDKFADLFSPRLDDLRFVRSHTQTDRLLHSLMLEVKQTIDLVLQPADRDGFP